MSTETLNSGAFLAKNDVSGRSSKTVRKFTGKIGGDSIPHAVSVSLDWLSFMVECWLPEPVPDQAPIFLTPDLVIKDMNRATPMFNHTWEVYYMAEPVATVLTHPRNEKIIKPGTAKVEILNHVLYSSTLNEVLSQILTNCKMGEIKNYSGLHIAIDGVNYLHRFVNDWQRQKKHRAMPELYTLGRWDKESRVKLKGKANVDMKRFNRATGDFDNMRIGSSKKYVTIYNKTSELKKSHKQYIKETWDRAGIDTSGTVWRCELRLTSGPIKEIKNFDLSKINDPNYLLQIFKTQCKNFFEFVLIENDCNVSRARIIDLFQFEKLKVPLLEKIPRAIVKGAYKAQMAIHNIVANINTGVIRAKASVDSALQHMTDLCDIYNLWEWRERKIEAWKEEYKSYLFAL